MVARLTMLRLWQTRQWPFFARVMQLQFAQSTASASGIDSTGSNGLGGALL
jgi:hypothetical protein